MRVRKVTGLPTWIYVTCGLQKTQSVHNGLGSTVVSVLLTAHGIWTRGCSHFTTVFGHAAPLNFIAAIVPPGNTSTPSVLRQLGAVWERSNLLERGTACILPGTSARYVFADISVVYLSWQCSFKGCGSGCCFCGKRSGLCSESARHNRTIRTHRSCCCLWPSTFAFAVCVTVLERTTIALRSSRCTTSQCTLDSPRITYIILCSPRVRTEHLLFSVAQIFWICCTRHCSGQASSVCGCFSLVCIREIHIKQRVFLHIYTQHIHLHVCTYIYTHKYIISLSLSLSLSQSLSFFLSLSL